MLLPPSTGPDSPVSRYSSKQEVDEYWERQEEELNLKINTMNDNKSTVK